MRKLELFDLKSRIQALAIDKLLHFNHVERVTYDQSSANEIPKNFKTPLQINNNAIINNIHQVQISLKHAQHKKANMIHRTMKKSVVSCLFILIFYFTSYGQVNAKGWLDGKSEMTIYGWACDTRFPNDIVAVHAWRDDNKFLGGSNANIPREAAVGAACGGGHSSHGFHFQLTVSEEFKDGREHRIHIYSIGRDGQTEQLSGSPISIKFPGQNSGAPQSIGNIVGRDLAWPVVGGLGHIGIWDGAYVIEVMNEKSVVQKNSYDNFSSRSNPWPILQTKWPTHRVSACYSASCTEYKNPLAGKTNVSAVYAIIQRANQIQAIGADYTWDIYIRPARPQVIIPAEFPYFPEKRWPPERGRYRCDTFILDLISATVRSPGQIHADINGDGYWAPTRSIDADITEWYKKYLEVRSMAVTTPVTLYNKLKGWQ